jgi:hypothetical protein
MSDIDLAVTNSKRLESLLEKKLGATGKGLHEKVSSVESRLPRELVRNLRLVATVRNKIVHESDYKSIDDRNAFLKASKQAEHELKAMGGGGSSGTKILVIGIIVLIIVIVAAFLLLRH